MALNLWASAGLLLPALIGCSAALAQTRVEEIRDRLINANAHRDHVMVVAHRGSWWKDGKIVLAENSMSAIDRAAALGVEMVELDVQKTSDGTFVILHDTTLDRTTTCTGEVAAMTLEAVRGCNLVIEGTGVTTTEIVPTLEEVLAAIKGRVLFNVDIKLGVEELANVVKIAQDMGVADHLVIKNRTGKPEEVTAAQATLAAITGPVIFMPILDDRDVPDLGPIRTTYAAFRPEAIEVLNRWRARRSRRTADSTSACPHAPWRCNTTRISGSTPCSRAVLPTSPAGAAIRSPLGRGWSRKAGGSGRGPVPRSSRPMSLKR